MKFFLPQESGFFGHETPVSAVFADFLPMLQLPQPPKEAIMAKTNPALHYSLFSWDSIDEFTQLDTLRKVIEIMPKAKQRVVRIKVKDSKHPVRVFGPCLAAPESGSSPRSGETHWSESMHASRATSCLTTTSSAAKPPCICTLPVA